jgi:CHAT domain-containing protein
MYAGAPSLVVSLWNVDDKATARLMTYFYGGMLKENLSPAAALRAAQLKMQGHKPWTAPYYWAGFALQGEWK